MCQIKRDTHSCIEHLVAEAAVKLLGVGLWKIKQGNTLKTKHAEAEREKPVRNSESSRHVSACLIFQFIPLISRRRRQGHHSKQWAPTGGLRCESRRVKRTSGLVELQGDVSVEAQAEVVVEHIQRQLRRQEKDKVTQWLKSQHFHSCLLGGRSQLTHYSP